MGLTDGVFVAVIEDVSDGVTDDVGVCVTVGVLVNVALKLYSPEGLYIALTLTEILLDTLTECDSVGDSVLLEESLG